jgi:hypothetical protein
MTFSAITWRICLRAQTAGPAEQMRDIYCGQPQMRKVRTDSLDIWAWNLCAAGPAFYETQIFYRRARSGSGWRSKTSPADNIDCAYSSSWRAAIRRYDSYRGLEAGMYAASDVPPPDRDNGITGTDNGFRAQRIIPPASLGGPQARLQSLAWRCGLGRGEPDRTSFVINEPWQAVWLRGDGLRAVGEHGNRRPSSHYANLSLRGRDRAYWRDATGTSYANAIHARLSVAVDGRTGFCRRDAALRVMRAIKRDLEAGRAPGGSPRSANWRQAWAFRPVLRFDTSEKWRPLDVDEFALEDPIGETDDAHRICREDDRCASLSSVISRPQGWTDDYVRVDMSNDDRGPGVEKYHTPHTECLPGGDTSTLRDCDSGRASTMYFRTTRPFREGSSSYRYIDYWMFYRYNHFDPSGASDHEADWEGVTIAPSPSGQTFHYAAFSQHGPYLAYLRSMLRCEDNRVRGDEGSCGTTSSSRKRVQVMVANGSHANYTKPCPETLPGSCQQNAGAIVERGYDGEKLWGYAFSEDAESLQPFPLTGGPGERAEWGSWEGNWSGNDTVDAPLQQTIDIACAHIDNPGGRCDGGPRSRSAGDESTPALEPSDDQLSPGLVALSCESWIGAGVNASTCDSDALRDAVATQTLEGEPVASEEALVAGDMTVAAPGLTQSAGEPLGDGDEVNVDALDGSEGTLRLRVVADDQLFIASFDAASLTAARRGPGTASAGALEVASTGAGASVALGGQAAAEVVPLERP